MKLLDFSSAWSVAGEAAGLYGADGPTRDEETVEYLDPEALFGDASASRPAPAQDAWAVGVVLLELLLGTRQAFVVDPRARALVGWRLRGEPRDVVEKALLLAALADLCVLPRGAATRAAARRIDRWVWLPRQFDEV